MPRKSEPVAAVEEATMEVDAEEAQRLKAERKAAKKAAKLAAQEEQQPEEVAMEVDEEEAQRLKAEKKAAKKAAKLAAQEEPAEVATVEVDEEEAQRLKAERKAAKKAAKQAAANEEPAQTKTEEDAPKKKRKADKTEDDDVAVPESKPEKKQKVEETEAKQSEEAPSASTESTEELTVFVGGIPWSVTEETFKKDFLECGEIEKLNLLKNEEGKPKGIAFITFKTKAGVDAALKFDGDDYGGRTLKVNLAGQGGKGKDGKSKGKGKDGKGKDGKSKGKGNAENEIFVGGLAFECTEDALKTHMSEYGEVVSLRMPLNEEGKAKGIAFICLKTAEEVEKALKLDGEEFMGRTLKVNKAGEGKGKGKDGKGKDGKGKDGKGKGKGKGKKGGLSEEKKAAKDGAMVESTGVKQTFEDSDDE